MNWRREGKNSVNFPSIHHSRAESRVHYRRTPPHVCVCPHVNYHHHQRMTQCRGDVIYELNFSSLRQLTLFDLTNLLKSSYK
jgi:hypothetical protein